MTRRHQHATKEQRKPRWKNAVFSTAVVGTAAALGTLATDPQSTWYRGLKKPTWQPPNEAFPIAWTTLYAGAVLTSVGVLNRLQRTGDEENASTYRRALVTNMGLNALWSYLFFQKKNLGAAAVGAGALAASTACLARRAGKAGALRGLSLVPYAAWTAFATLLSADLWHRNS